MGRRHNSTTIRIRLKLYGVFRTTAKTGEISVDIPDHDATVMGVINRLVSQHGLGDLKPLLMEGQSADPRSNALIIVSGREISALRGLETELTDGDELELLPVAHGG
jgi:molybdopterin converting factor small subunit